MTELKAEAVEDIFAVVKDIAQGKPNNTAYSGDVSREMARAVLAKHEIPWTEYQAKAQRWIRPSGGLSSTGAHRRKR